MSSDGSGSPSRVLDPDDSLPEPEEEYATPGEEGSGQWMVEILQEAFLKDAQAALEEHLFPKAAAIQEAAKALQEECAEVSDVMSAERERSAAELRDLTAMLGSFQQRIQESLGQLGWRPPPEEGQQQ